MNDTTTSTFPKSWAHHLRMLQACFKVWTEDLMTSGPETLANNATDLYHMWVVWNNRPDELHRLDDAIWEEEVDAVQRVSKWLDQTGWLVMFMPRWHHIDGWVWLCIEAKNGFAWASELSLPALASSATPAPLSRQKGGRLGSRIGMLASRLPKILHSIWKWSGQLATTNWTFWMAGMPSADLGGAGDDGGKVEVAVAMRVNSRSGDQECGTEDS
ncbi:hypothetical protein DXG03_002493 [Asterophora parasitica]|uniref:Uncharacterized protein n=1 Tax=Asterophora parasitica TaxID=117018 RepID=A0A9P7G2Y7_9AGAR|nr:hypothetical protein DXG03_002493 [Asterophora parasitica]